MGLGTSPSYVWHPEYILPWWLWPPVPIQYIDQLLDKDELARMTVRQIDLQLEMLVEIQKELKATRSRLQKKYKLT